ncbi:hypothetical protein [Microbacterium soli]|uniref:Lipoprotein n=1 Tax=Microbacterium soli TaxID=446075 RepID=A0ABP7MRG7_9MICO
MGKAVMMGVVGLLAFLLGGCSPVPSDPRAVLEGKAATIDAAVQDLFETLAVAGLQDVSAASAVDTCQSEPAPGVSYRAGMTVKAGEDLAGGFDALVRQLDAAGWKSTGAYQDVEIDPARPMGRFVRDDITLDVKTGGASSGGVWYGADEMQLGVTIDDDCVRVPDGGYIGKVEDLAKDILPRR